ncbi:copper homeostasis protein CutC [Gracilibacillus caseinilyticus]|uniref:PF03932 family protein CutC n=1 Tax=Gracilibacillus caseinilyticus TaxID=2932256 RepID=A0ABY4EWB2_9BACI|nr:copper homeostasis protein CutC [Gracilibacillus caseinilyticus]UOQ48684.1 copper homeostasis protein CutC [Gracilibacillus caseinilyticus]
MLVEFIVQNAEEAVRAECLGADRLELVSAISEGGLTPSHGALKGVLRSVSIPVQVMVRPHSYQFRYSSADKAIMLEDIDHVVSLGGKGIVIGGLTEDDTIDESLLEAVVTRFPTIDITFHRAFDAVRSQSEAYSTLTKYHPHIKRILTSGGEANCTAGLSQLRELLALSKQLNGPRIMPGSGLSPSNIASIHDSVNASQYHFGSSIRKQQSFQQSFNETAVQALTDFKATH